MSIKKMYHYFYYKLYKFSEAAPSRWLSDWKAELVLDVLILLITFPLVVYYTLYTGNIINFKNEKLIAALYFILVGGSNFLIFHSKNQWKSIVTEFDKLPKKKNRLGGIVVGAVILFIIVNLILSVYAMDVDAKKNHTGPYSIENSVKK
jgi:uncharacterized protein YjeT (DUF2065 family)